MPLRGAIIGCGFFAQNHIEAWRRMPGVDLIAACDPQLQRAGAAAPNAYASAERLFDSERLDFVDIATRPELHLPMVELAVAHRVPIICQKPMAPTWADCVRIAAITSNAKIPCMIHENWRFQPWYRECARLIRNGAIGTPVTYQFQSYRRDGLGHEPYPDQPYFRAMPRFIIYETIVHQIDTARFLFGNLSRVYAQARRINPIVAGEDHAILVLTHTSALQGSIDGHRFFEVQPVGPVLGEAYFVGDAARILVLPSGDVQLNEKVVWQNTVEAGYRGDSVRATQEHFVSCLTSGAPFETAASAYLDTVAAVEAAYESIANRCAIDV